MTDLTDAQKDRVVELARAVCAELEGGGPFRFGDAITALRAALNPPEVKPLPCPFCGHEAEVLSPGRGLDAVVMCAQGGAVCPIDVSASGATEAQAVAKWNRRAQA